MAWKFWESFKQSFSKLFWDGLEKSKGYKNLITRLEKDLEKELDFFTPKTYKAAFGSSLILSVSDDRGNIIGYL
jgi:hypothetical protein